MSKPQHPARPPLGRRFLTVWAGQTLSSIGSAMSAVGVGVYVYLATGNALWLGLLAALVAIPAVLVAPFAGVIDRHQRRTVMIAADTFAAVGPSIALVLAVLGELEVWHLAVAGFLAALGNSVQSPAAQAAVPSLVEPEALGRANGLNQLGPALGFVIGPIVATPLIAAWGVRSVLIVDAVTFVIAVTATVSVRFDDAVDRSGAPVDDDRSWSVAWNWLRTTGRPLLVLMLSMAIVNGALGVFNVAIQVVAIDVGGIARAGLVFGTAGVAMVAGSLWLGSHGVPRRRMRAFARGLGLVSLGGAIAGLRPSLAVVIAGTAVALVAVPALNAVSATLFHEHVPATMQGRVFGLRYAMARALDPIGSLLGGLFVARLAEPALTDNGWAASSVGSVIGTGDGRGAAATLIAVSLSLAGLAAWLTRASALQGLDTHAGLGNSGPDVGQRTCAGNRYVCVNSH